MRRVLRFARWAPALAAPMLVGCASHSSPAGAGAAAVEPLGGNELAFAASSMILSGFDLAPDPDGWNIGDRVLMGIRLSRPKGEMTRFLLVELTDQFDPVHQMEFTVGAKGSRQLTISSPMAGTRLVLFDENGRELDRVIGQFPIKLLGSGLYDGAAPGVGHAMTDDAPSVMDTLPEAEYERAIRGWLTLFAFSGSLNKRGMFRPLQDEVLARPNLIALAFNPTISLASGGKGPRQAEKWSPGGGVEIDRIEMPLSCFIAGKPSAEAQVEMARPVAPLSLCGGIVRTWGQNADDARVRFEIVLLAAARGSGGQVFKVMDGEPKP